MNVKFLSIATILFTTICLNHSAHSNEPIKMSFQSTLFNEQDISSDRLNPTNVGRLKFGKNVISAEFARDDFDYFTVTIPNWLVLDKIYLTSWETRPCFEDVGFFAIVEGDSFDFEFPNPNNPENPAEGLLGWTHLRSTQVASDVGVCSGDILCEMGLANLPPIDAGLSETFELEAGLVSGVNPYDSITDQAICDGFTAEDLQSRLVNLTNSWAPGATGFDGPLDPGTYSFWLRQGSDTRVKIDMVLVTKFKY